MAYSYAEQPASCLIASIFNQLVSFVDSRKINTSRYCVIIVCESFGHISIRWRHLCVRRKAKHTLAGVSLRRWRGWVVFVQMELGELCYKMSVHVLCFLEIRCVSWLFMATKKAAGENFESCSITYVFMLWICNIFNFKMSIEQFTII